LKNSFSRSPKLPKLPPQSTSSLLLIAVFGAAGEARKKLRFSRNPEPNFTFPNGASARSLILMGRSKRNCFRLDQKLSAIRMAGVPNCGSAEFGTGIASSGPVRFGFLISSGRRLISPGTLYPLKVDWPRVSHKRFIKPYDSHRLGKVARAPRLTHPCFHCNIRTYTALRSFPPFNTTLHRIGDEMAMKIGLKYWK